MTIHTHTGPATQTTDADFTTRANEFYAALEAVLVHVPQTGELAYPAVGLVRVANANAGWRMYRIPGGLHATAPVYIKMSFGCADLVSEHNSQMQVGTAVDGSGNFVGVAGSTINLGQGNSAPQAGNYETHACSVSDEGFFLMFKSGGISTGRANAGCFCYRTNDSNGEPDSIGVVYGRPLSSSNATNSAPTAYTLRFAAPNVEINLSSNFVWAAGGSSSSGGLGGEIEAYLAYCRAPLTKPLHSICGVWPAEFPFGTVFSATLVGSASRNYISMAGTGNAQNDSARPLAFAFLWEA
jgi:hypothetical protein